MPTPWWPSKCPGYGWICHRSAFVWLHVSIEPHPLHANILMFCPPPASLQSSLAFIFSFTLHLHLCRNKGFWLDVGAVFAQKKITSSCETKCWQICTPLPMPTWEWSPFVFDQFIFLSSLTAVKLNQLNPLGAEIRSGPLPVYPPAVPQRWISVCSGGAMELMSACFSSFSSSPSCFLLPDPILGS